MAKPNDPTAIVTLPDGLGIRVYRPSDIPALSHHGNNKAIWNNCRNRVPSPYTVQGAAEWIYHNLNPANHVRSGAWTAETGSQGALIPTNYAITLNDELIGTIGLAFGELKEVYERTAEIGYWLGEQYWGQGIMAKIVPALVQWAWNKFGILMRLNAEVNELNPASRKCLEKAGFVVEGFKKWSIYKNGQLQSAYILGMLRPGAES